MSTGTTYYWQVRANHAYGKGTSVNARYQGLVNEIGREVEIRRAPTRPGDTYLTYFDCSKAESELGCKAELGLINQIWATCTLIPIAK